MAEEFQPINTQEEFDAAVTQRYGDVANLQQQVNTLTNERDTHANTIAQLQKEVNGYKTTALKQKIAKEKGIPLEFAARLSGETEADIKADADSMAGLLRTVKGPAPLADPNPADPDAKNTSMISMLNELRGE